jgi:diguanylate cyclase (GGDEF)-like protein
MKGGHDMSRILVVDDSLVDRRIISKIIQKNIPDALLFETDDGYEVESMIVSEQIELCILDLRMPKRNGMDILASIKSKEATMDVPVIVCTGHLETETLIKVLTLGAYDYFTKPLSEEVMKIALPLKVKNAIEHMRRTKHIKKLSQIDALTGLYNRHSFKSTLMSYQKGGGSVMMVDINGLKLVNDAFGSDFGDDYMVNLSNIIREVCPENAVCARWGGDEFAMLLPGANKKVTNDVAKKIQNKFKKSQTGELCLSLAFGWETSFGKETDYLKLLTKAEDGMIRDKILENESTRSSMIAAILHTLHEKNPREEAHSRRVSQMCFKMGSALQLNDKEIQDLKIIGLLHDIGKIAIDENILNKPSELTHEEWTTIRRHPEIGHRILSGAPEMKEYANIILCHHERFDGKGYPNKLSGLNIPLYSRLLTIVDSYDAMTCERPYRKALSHQEAVNELYKSAGTQFDESLLDIFTSYVI